MARPIDVDTALTWQGRDVRDPHGEELGRIGDLYLDGTTDLPAYAGVRTGLFGRHESVVPLAGIAELEGELVAVYPAALVRDAPRLSPGDVLSVEEEHLLELHFGAVTGRDDEAAPDDN